MTLNRGWGISESHLLPDVVVAFVDQELSLGAQERAAAHLAHCPGCVAEVAAQRSASTAVRRADTPSISAGFLADLRAIPQQTEMPSVPDDLAVDTDGQIITVRRSNRVAGLRGGLSDGALGTSAPLGTAPTVLGSGPRFGEVRRRATQGAGVVVSGLVLSALAFVTTSSVGSPSGNNTDAEGESPASPASGVWRAQFGAPRGAAPAVSSTTPPRPEPVPAAPTGAASSTAPSSVKPSSAEPTSTKPSPAGAATTTGPSADTATSGPGSTGPGVLTSSVQGPR